MKKGDRVIIDGPNGYEIGVIHIPDPIPNPNYTMVEVYSGTLAGMLAMFQVVALMEYSEGIIDILKYQHGYEKRFAKEF